MSEFRLSFPACVIAGKPLLSREDLALLRLHTFPDGVETPDGAITLLALHNSCPRKCPEWSDFFVQSITRFIVHRRVPHGALDAINADWLQRLLSSDGVVASALELELLLHVIDVSGRAPPSLTVFALEQLRIALCEPVGAYALGRPVKRRGVTRHDLEFVRRVLNAPAGTEVVPLAAAEIAMLLRIDRLTQPCDNHSGWADMLASVRPRQATEADPAPGHWLRVGDDDLRATAAA